MRQLAIVAAAAALSACAATLPAVAGPDRPMAGIGQTARVGGLTIRPLAVVEDSRCPMNARCVWAGRIVVRVAVSGRGARTTRDLTLGQPLDHAGGHLALISAEPNRMAGTPAARPARYRFTFSYER